MAKYLIQASLTAAGTRGVLKDGGSSRRDAIDQLVRSLGGRLESYYFTFAPDMDAFAIVELPDAASAAAASLIISAAGTAAAQTTLLIEPAEIDAALRLSQGGEGDRV